MSTRATLSPATDRGHVMDQQAIVVALRSHLRAFKPTYANGEVTFFLDDGRLHVHVLPAGSLSNAVA